MPLFKVTVQGHGLWIDIDAEVQRVGFQVTRVVDADDRTSAAEKALSLIRSDPKARQLPGKPPPQLFVNEVLPTDSAPPVNPGFMFFPDPESPAVDRIPGPEPTPDVALARVLVTGDAGLIPLAKSLLEGEGIEYLIRGEGLQDLFGWGRVGSGYNYIVGPAEFWVRADEAERARELLKGLDTQSSADTEPPHDA